MATNTYVALAKSVVSGSATSSVTLDLSNVTGMKHLVIAFDIIPTTNGTPNGFFRLNGDTGTNYSYDYFVGNGTTGTGGTNTNQSMGYVFASGITSSHLVGKAYINNFANSNDWKNVLVRSGDAGNQVNYWTNTWRNTNPVTSITFYTSSDSYAVGSSFTVYGLASEAPAPKATGGAIYTDAEYYYHVFGVTGAFVPSQSLTADVMVVAGGGGAGSDDGGAGGAGGLALQTGRSFSATSYTCTVGGGGGGSSSAVIGSNGGNSTLDTITATGGGGGGTGNAAGGRSGANGGSGGGGSYVRDGGGGGGFGGTGITGTSGGATLYGSNGGTGYNTTPYGTGGGGGAGAAGGNGSGSAGGAGGVGRTDSLINAIGFATGVGEYVAGNYYIAGGGGGSIVGSNTVGTGGYGGGSAGGRTTASKNASPNTGGGGGADRTNGGSGVIIVRYLK